MVVPTRGYPQDDAVIDYGLVKLATMFPLTVMLDSDRERALSVPVDTRTLDP